MRCQNKTSFHGLVKIDKVDENTSKRPSKILVKNKKVNKTFCTFVTSQMHIQANLVTRCKTSGTMKHNEQQNYVGFLLNSLQRNKYVVNN
jgi:hypothetical protein